MHSLLQSAQNDHQKPLWLRLIAILCVLLICVMSTAQACHRHADVSSIKQNSDHNSPASDDHCPLCVAMHSALPATLHDAPEPVVQVHALDSVAADAERAFRWRFEMASRPPPANADRA